MSIMVENYLRPNVTPRRYRQLENLEMELALLLPEDLGEACIVFDLLHNRLRRYVAGERLPRHELPTDDNVVKIRP